MKAEKVLNYMIDTLLLYAEELKDVYDGTDLKFEYGEKTAYIECLEMLSLWEGASGCGLDFDVEKAFGL